MNRGQKLVRQEDWDKLCQEIRQFDEMRTTTSGGSPISEILTLGARYDVIRPLEVVLRFREPKLVVPSERAVKIALRRAAVAAASASRAQDKEQDSVLLLLDHLAICKAAANVRHWGQTTRCGPSWTDRPVSGAFRFRTGFSGTRSRAK